LGLSVDTGTNTGAMDRSRQRRRGDKTSQRRLTAPPVSNAYNV
jgi:hypothetical protein